MAVATRRGARHRLWRPSSCRCAGAPATAACTRRTPALGSRRAASSRRVYDAIFDARFDEVPRAVARRTRDRARRRAPPEACQLLDAVSLWWQMQLDPHDPSRDAAFAARVDAAIAAIEAWTAQRAERAEAWFYLGGAYGARAQWRVLRGERLAAARDGKRIKEALERALVLDPDLQDAYFGIGLYHYYADVAPGGGQDAALAAGAARRRPGEGLREMLRARQRRRAAAERGRLPAAPDLSLVREDSPSGRSTLLRGLRERHPRNPLFAAAVAEVEDVYLRDYDGEPRIVAALLAAARARRVAGPRPTEVRARLGMARQLDALSETDSAIEHLRAVVAAAPAAPFGALAQAQLQLGRGARPAGRAREALAAYRAALARTPAGDPLKMAARARAGLRRTPDATPRSPTGCRSRAGARSNAATSAAAARALDRVAGAATRRSGHPLSPGAAAARAADDARRHRRARGASSPRRDDAADVYAAACLDAARLYERQRDDGARDRALRARRDGVRRRSAHEGRGHARSRGSRSRRDHARSVRARRTRHRAVEVARVEPRLDIEGEIGRGSVRRFLTSCAILCLTAENLTHNLHLV